MKASIQEETTAITTLSKIEVTDIFTSIAKQISEILKEFEYTIRISNKAIILNIFINKKCILADNYIDQQLTLIANIRYTKNFISDIFVFCVGSAFIEDSEILTAKPYSKKFDLYIKEFLAFIKDNQQFFTIN